MAKYTPDDKYFKIPNNGLFIGINNAEVGKSYTFSIKPRFDIEKEVKLIIFLIPDLQAAVDNNLLSIEFATGLSLAGLIPDPNNTNNYIPAPIQGQAKAYAEIINLPTVNPKNNTNLSSSSDFDLNQRIITFNTSGIKQMQIIYPDETKYRTSSGKSVNSIDEYIDEVLITAENVYKINMYQISISTEADFAKFDLPENKVEFTQEQPKPEEITEDKKDNESVTNTEKPVAKTGITFDVTKEGIFTNAEFGELKVVNPSLDGFDFGDDFEDLDLLDDEYTELDFDGLTEEEFNAQQEIADYQEDALSTEETTNIGQPVDIQPVSDFNSLLKLAGKLARELGKNARVKYENLNRGYTKGIHGLCPQGTQAVLAALTGVKELGKISGNADWFSFKTPGTGGSNASFSKSGYYKDKIKITQKNGSWKGTYIQDSSQWQVGDIVAMGYLNGKKYGHIQIWTGVKWMSDFKQNKIQQNNVDPNTVALWRLSEKGLEALNKQSGRLA
jgi:hypothetical protein